MNILNSKDGQDIKYSLSKDQVTELLLPVTNSDVVNELYSFGSMLVSETKEMRNRIESKALNVLTWSIAIVAFIYTQLPRGAIGIKCIFLISMLAASIAIWFSYCAIRLTSRSIPSDEDWFEVDCLKNPNSHIIRLYHVQSLHVLKHDLLIVAAKKSKYLSCAETYLVVSAGAFVIAVIAKMFIAS